MRSLVLWMCLLCIASYTTWTYQGSSSDLQDAASHVAVEKETSQQASNRQRGNSTRCNNKGTKSEPGGERAVSLRSSAPCESQETFTGANVKFIYTKHARERMEQRGANDNEVEDTILTGTEVPAYGGKQKFEKTYDCDCHYKGKYYDDKKVEVVAKKKSDGWVIITVIADRK